MRVSHLPSRGFTLVEVLIALAIVAVGLAAAVRASSQVTSGAQELKARTLALWVAEDRLTDHAARRTFPNPGVTEGTSVQGGLDFVWRERVQASAQPMVRIIEVTVAPAAQPDYVVARLTGAAVLPEREQ